MPKKILYLQRKEFVSLIERLAVRFGLKMVGVCYIYNIKYI